MDQKKTVIIGIDGATFDIIKPLITAGRLPNIAGLIKTGCHGSLNSTIPPITAPAWVSFMTGKEPSNHGLFLFFHYKPELFLKGDFPLATTASIKANTIWEILKDQGKKSIAVNVPMTYPPFAVDGIMISGMGTPEGSPNYIYPPELADQIKKEIGFCRIVDPRFRDLSKNKNMLNDLLISLYEAEKKRVVLARHLLDNYNWDLFMIVFTLTDRVQHFLWGVGSKVEESYEKVDGLIGRLLEKIDDSTNVFLMSDHGFGQQKGFICINKWLKDNGYLAIKKIGIKDIHKLYSIRTLQVTLERLAVKARARFILSVLPRALRKKVIWMPYLLKNGMAVVDWSKTKAYGAASGIRINLKGREPYGIINNNGDCTALKKEIIDRLYQIEHPGTKQKLMDIVLTREEVYQGPFISEAPDILFMADGLAYPQLDRVDSKGLLAASDLKGCHRLNGIFVANGQGFKKGAKVDWANIIDILPTVLYAMNLPIPDDIDGKILRDCFEKEYLRTHGHRVAVAGDVKLFSASYTKEEDKEIRSRLKELGYLE